MKNALGFFMLMLSSAVAFSQQPADTVLKEQHEELEEVEITATRSIRSFRDIPTRVETITAGELHEKAVMQPGNIRMLLTESTGIQTQQTSAVSGSAGIRIQGLDGRYTMMLKDGFPLYGGFSGGLSILQIPPLDLKRVEVIKGSASTLYGGGAIAGLVNLVTKQPSENRELTFLANANQTGAYDFSGYYGEKLRNFGITVFGARNTQRAYDNNDDAFSDIPGYQRYTFNPRILLYLPQSVSMSLGLNTSFENREGGDMFALKNIIDTSHAYFEKNKSYRYSTQFRFEKKFDNQSVLTIKNSVGNFRRRISLSDYFFSGNQYLTYSELSYLLPKSKSEWVGGLNFITDRFNHTNETLYRLSYNLTTAGVFMQNNWKPDEKFVLETGLRLDYTNQSEFFVLPRVSAMYKFNSHFTSRIGGGLGYKTPDIFTEAAEEKNFRHIQPLQLSDVKTERSVGMNIDVNYKGKIADVGSITVNQLFFLTRLSRPLLLNTMPQANGNFAFFNADGFLISRGFETNVRLAYDEWSVYIGYTFTDATRNFENITVNPLTARHRINYNLMYEIEGKWRFAYELFYTGSQYLTSGERVRDYWVMGFSGERRFRYFSLFVNFENFLDTRQSKWEPMYTGGVLHPDFREIYTPTDGFIFNGGFRVFL
jgi:outer membrane receptor for ferrienterochelin and colicins